MQERVGTNCLVGTKQYYHINCDPFQKIDFVVFVIGIVGYSYRPNTLEAEEDNILGVSWVT